LGSEIDQIKGIGQETLKKLFEIFKSIERIKKAEEKELENIIGKAKTGILLKYFKNHPGSGKN